MLAIQRTAPVAAPSAARGVNGLNGLIEKGEYLIVGRAGQRIRRPVERTSSVNDGRGAIDESATANRSSDRSEQ